MSSDSKSSQEDLGQLREFPRGFHLSLKVKRGDGQGCWDEEGREFQG